MAIREIRTNGDEILSKKCKVVKNFDERLHILIDDMIETMREKDGAGLAAPQVGILKRVFVADDGNELVEAINPEIVSVSGEQRGKEGCLSVPGEYYYVTRPYKVVLKAQDRYGNEFTKEATGLMARAFLHESDHLDGILFLEKMDEYQPEDEDEENEEE